MFDKLIEELVVESTVDKYVVYINCHKKDNGRYSFHYKDPMGNHTLCGLSMKQGHHWDIARIQRVSCTACEAVRYRRELRLGEAQNEE